MTQEDYWAGLSFTDVINQYRALQQKVMSQVTSLSTNICTASPGKFLLLQFQVGQMTQIGESLSNVISMVQSVINNAVRNQKTQ